MTDAAAGVSVTITSMMMSGFTTFLPPLREIRQGNPNDKTLRNDVRYGQFAAGILAVGIGSLMSYLSKSSLPLYVGILTALLYAGIYEMALQNRKA